MILYQNTFENIKTLNCDFPIEDQFYGENNFAIVADGITRDPIGIPDLSKVSFSEMLDHYPRPSGGELAAKEVVNFIQTQTINTDLKNLLINANKQVAKLNKKSIPTCDYLENDFYGTVASCCYIDDYQLHYSYICDCGVIVYDSMGNIKFQTIDDKETYSDPYINQIGIPWHLPESRVIVRRDYRNNVDNIQNGSCVSYGALTGEESASSFIRSGTFNLSNGDFVIVYSDGFTFFLKEDTFIQQVLSFNEKRFCHYVEQKSLENYEKFGKEKTLILIKV